MSFRAVRVLSLCADRASFAVRAGSRHEAGDAFARFARDEALIARLKERHALDLDLYARARAIMCRDLRLAEANPD